jgi:hypothetical protein
MSRPIVCRQKGVRPKDVASICCEWFQATNTFLLEKQENEKIYSFIAISEKSYKLEEDGCITEKQSYI